MTKWYTQSGKVLTTGSGMSLKLRGCCCNITRVMLNPDSVLAQYNNGASLCFQSYTLTNGVPSTTVDLVCGTYTGIRWIALNGSRVQFDGSKFFVTGFEVSLASFDAAATGTVFYEQTYPSGTYGGCTYPARTAKLIKG